MLNDGYSERDVEILFNFKSMKQKRRGKIK